MQTQCVFCHLRTVESLIKKFRPEPEIADQFVNNALRLLADNPKTPNPVVATEIHRLARKALGIDDLYRDEKHEANRLLLDHYETWESIVRESPNPAKMALRLAVLGNVIDYGAHIVSDDLLTQVRSFLETLPVVDDSDQLLADAASAKSILYLADNAGEIVLDRLLIESLDREKVTVAVRGFPVINDVTLEDAAEVGLDKTCRVIGNGYDAPSTILEECSDELRTAYEEADLVIAKGQGNLEGLIRERRPGLYFLLMAKCDPIADATGVNPGDMLIAASSRLRDAF